MDESSSIVDNDLTCPDCGYNLRSIQSDRCPECGLTIDRSILGESIIPWLHREKLGRFRAFWKTVHMMTFRPRQLAREMARPARFADAIAFRRVVVLHALAPLGLVLTGLYVGALTDFEFRPALLWNPADRLASMLQLLAMPFGWLCLGLYLFAVTGVGSYLFHPGSLSVVQQNRAIALSYYACGPLAYSALTIALLVGVGAAAAAATESRAILLAGFFYLLAVVPVLMQLIAWYRGSLVLLRATTHSGAGRQAAMSVLLPVMWAALAVLILGILPLGFILLAIMAVSLQS